MSEECGKQTDLHEYCNLRRVRFVRDYKIIKKHSDFSLLYCTNDPKKGPVQLCLLAFVGYSGLSPKHLFVIYAAMHFYLFWTHVAETEMVPGRASDY